MAIRLRRVEGILIALCAAETDPLPDDQYIDDEAHYALVAKFWRDYAGQPFAPCPEHDRLAETQRLRDARSELETWLSLASGQRGDR